MIFAMSQDYFCKLLLYLTIENCQIEICKKSI